MLKMIRIKILKIFKFKMCDELSEFQISAFRDAFNHFDEDGDGFITTRELGKVLTALGRNPTDSELVKLKLKFNFRMFEL